MKHLYKLYLFILVCFSSNLFAQGYYLVYLKNKTQHVPALSKESITKKNLRNIPINEADFPVDNMSIENIQNVGVTIHSTSRWFNVVCIYSTDLEKIKQIQNLDFVKKIEILKQDFTIISTIKKLELNSTKSDPVNGFSKDQIALHNADFLYDKNYKGQGIKIAVFDAGFPAVDTMSFFKKARGTNRIIPVWDFVSKNKNLYDDAYHGTEVLSCMVADSDYVYKGTALEATYFLCRTEDDNSESRIEEYNWLLAAEKADSLGVDIINSSLGYSTMDNSAESYSYNDMNGKTTIVTKAAEIAFSKGILVVNSAGNAGQSTWYHITAPADGEHVLTVGAVDKNAIIGKFSSRGPSSDGRLKPDVCAVGEHAFVCNTQNKVTQNSGTSFASPIMAGLCASLWSAFPMASNTDLLYAVKFSSDRFYSANNDYGYGIPDFKKAYEILASKFSNQTSKPDIFLYRNTSTNALWVEFNNITNPFFTLKIIDASGKTISKKYLTVEPSLSTYLYTDISTQGLPKGIYFLSVETTQKSYSQKFLVE